MKELGRCGRKSVANEKWPQTGLAYLASILGKDGHNIKIIDGMVQKFSTEEIRKFNPRIAVLSTTTPTFNNDAKVAKMIKEDFDCCLGFVGTHVSVLPEKSLKESVADFIAVNEAEYTLLDLVRNLNSSWKNVSGLYYKSKDRIIKTKDREPIKDLDELPFPSRHLLPNQKYTMPLTRGNPFATIISSRGCPYRCIFCRAGSVWGKGVRARTTENVVKEIEFVVKDLNIKYFVFMTDTFTLNKKWTIDLCKKVIDKKLDIKFLCNSRVDTIDEETLKIMKKAGCISISYGIESGDQEILNTSKKGTTLEQATKAVQLTKKTRISVFAYFILGLPGETWKTIFKTIRFAKKLDPDYVNFHIATPFPGTELYDIAKRNNWIVSENWGDFEEQGSSVIRTKHLTSDDLVKAQKMAMNSFYLRPGKIISELLKIRSMNDLKIRVKTAFKFI